eukprot:6899810-Lingulodinium_polyedra.AAC.1
MPTRRGAYSLPQKEVFAGAGGEGAVKARGRVDGCTALEPCDAVEGQDAQRFPERVAQVTMGLLAGFRGLAAVDAQRGP